MSRVENPATPSALPAPPAAIPPLLPVVLTLVVVAMILSVFFAWLFPPVGPAQAVPVARFTDITAEAGLALPTGPVSPDSPTTLGGGVAVIDFDQDGHPDLLFVRGCPWPWEEPMAKQASRGSLVLMRNDGHGHFTDVTARAGLQVELQGMAAAIGDFDNDGWPDIFVTGVGQNHLFRNRGNGRFEDVTEPAGVGGEDNTWSTGAAWIDYDGDGRLDLVVAHYARWPREVGLASSFMIAAVGRSYGTPSGFLGALPSVYRNVGDGRFVLVPGSANLRTIDSATGLPVAKALAVIPVDANGDGRLDLWFTYHTAAPELFLNQGDGTFRRWQENTDNRHEGATASLASGLSALAPTAEADETFAALQSTAASDGPRREEGPVTLRGRLGGVLLDYDLGGHLAWFSGNSRAEPDVNKFEDGRDFTAAAGLYFLRNGRWVAAPEAGAWSRPLVARGIAAADFDGDGDEDIIIAQHDGPPRLLRNDQRGNQPWLRLQLVATRGPVEAGGARVEVHTPRRILRRTLAPAAGFMAQSESALTFGLGEDTRVRKIVILWPSGQRQELHPAGINQTLLIREP